MSEYQPKYRITVEKQAPDGSWAAAPDVTPDDVLDGFLLLGLHPPEMTSIEGNVSKQDIVYLLARSPAVGGLLLPLAMIEYVQRQVKADKEAPENE